MFIVNRNDSLSPPKIEFIGIIDEFVRFAESVGPLPESAHFACAGVKRINSVGIKLWKEFFQDLRARNVRLVFSEISPALVPTFNYLREFILIHEIESIGVPFYCAACGTTTIQNFTVAELNANHGEFVGYKCADCNGPAEFDEIKDDYLSFLGWK